MEIVFVMLNNYQEYIIDNIKQLKKFENTNITLITDKKFFSFLNENINMIEAEKLLEEYINVRKSLKKTFKNGFWKLTSYRFNILKEYMKKYDKKNIIHLENDVLLYRNLEELEFHTKEKILITMDSKNRCIPGIMFIPNYQLLEKCLETFSEKKNDMENWSECYYLNDHVDTLPIISSNLELTFESDKETYKIISENYIYYNSVFDAAAIGQYLGGVDPRNIKGNTVGFINETCIVDYSKYKFIWKLDSLNRKIPYILLGEIEIVINNLHIHCKNLKKFMS